MGELGERLKTAREEKGLSLHQVSEVTRIPLSYLEALEAEAFQVFASDLHARGFFRNYASFLGLDADRLLGHLGEHRLSPVAAGRSPLSRRGLADQPGAVAASGELARSGRGSTWVLDALLVLVVFVALTLVGLSVYRQRISSAITPTPGPPSTPTVTPMPVVEGTAYTMDVDLNYEEHKLAVRQRIDYTNVTSQTLPNLMLNVHPNHYRNTFKLDDIKVDIDGEKVQPEVFPLDVTLRVELPRELKANEHVTLLLQFTLNLPKISPSEEFSGGSFGYSKQAVSLGNWYPVLAPYREDKGWYGLTYFPVGDPYVTEVADYHVTITTTQNVIVAASGQGTRTGNVWRFEAAKARSFAFAASNHYQVATSQIGNVAVHSYYFPESQAAAEAALETATKAIALFSELFGPYPYSEYRLAETEFAGGMEFTGLTFLGSVFYGEYDGTTRTPLLPLTAHEVSHQWFYGLVGSDQVSEPWLDEGIAEYSAYLYYERYLPGDAEWWWTYAVDQWAPTGKIDALIYEFRDNREYVDAVYRRGAQFVRDLRQVMGDPAFFSFLREYQRRHAYHLARSRDFFALVREFTTADLVPLQEEYFRQRILP